MGPLDSCFQLTARSAYSHAYRDQICPRCDSSIDRFSKISGDSSFPHIEAENTYSVWGK